MKNEGKQNPRSDTKPHKANKNKKGDIYYDTYQKYIKSKGFKQLRSYVLERDGYKCQCCGRTAEDTSLQAHHSTYENVGKCNEEEAADLITVCKICHYSIHNAKSNLRRFSDKTYIIENIKNNPQMEFKIGDKDNG